MNREIKFRGWFQGINGTGMWVYGYLTKQTNGNWEITDGETSWTVDDVGQFTGLYDKNNKEIYECDILECGYGVGKVKFHAGCFMIEWGSDPMADMEFVFSRDTYRIRENEDMFEIIGNIYENQELLK